ncbi:MAG TPA: von Willebrand factor type A domain-containing protein [Polyangiaceae bacterium]|nr:von Willebrand factor type A domain-containing protein [Polyangiaceae bacterium]
MKAWSLAAWGPVFLLAMSGCSASMGGDDDDSSPAAASGSSKNVGNGSSAPGTPNLSASGGSGNYLGGAAAGTTSMSTNPNAPSDAAASGGAGAEEPTAEPIPVLPTNPFVITAHDPLSTFAADVDTASYDIFTSSVNNGSLPPAATVRLEEFVNYFHYGYTPPASDATEPFSISLAAAPAPDPSTLLLRVGIQGRMPATKKRPANLVFLVDTSGSMAAENKLPLVQYTLTEALTALDSTDKISIVSYAGSTSVRLEPTPVADAATIEAAIAGLTTGGGTNGSSGIQLAYQQAESAFIEGGINHVLLCTDGDFNLGVTSNDALVELITEKRKTGVTFTALGYGSNPNDAMMERVSDAGNGTYSVIYSKGQAREYVENRLLSSLDFIAKDMKIQVEFNPAKVYAYRLLGYEDRDIADSDFRNDVVDAGEVGAGHRVTALYQLVLAGGAIPNASGAPAAQDGAAFSGQAEVAAEDYALVKVRYKAPDATEQDPAAEVNQSLPADGIADSWSDLDPDFQWAYAVATFAEILKKSPYSSTSSLQVIEQILKQPANDTEAERVEFRTSFDKAKLLLAK